MIETCVTFEQVRLRPTDWSRLLLELRKAGYTYGTLASAVAISRTQLFRYATGAIPKHDDGEVLIAFWCEVYGRARQDAPVKISRNWNGLGV